MTSVIVLLRNYLKNGGSVSTFYICSIYFAVKMYAVRHDVRKLHGDGTGIIGYTYHQFSHGNVVEPVMGQAFAMSKEILTDAGYDLPPCSMEYNRLNAGTAQGYCENESVYNNKSEKIGY